MSTDQDKDTFSLKRNRGDGGLEGLGGGGLLLGSPDKKKRKSNTQSPSFSPLSEYAPPANPSSDHLVASNPFDDDYSSPPLSLKPLNSSSPYFGPSHYPGFGGYGPSRPPPQIHNRMPSPYGGPYQIRNQPHPFAQGPMGSTPLGFTRPPPFSYGHPENTGFPNQPIFNNNGSMHLPTVQPFRPGLAESAPQLPLPTLNHSRVDGPGPGFGMEAPAGRTLVVVAKPGPGVSPGLPQPPSSFGQSNTPTPKQDQSDSTSKSTGQNAASPRKQNASSEEGGAMDVQAEAKGKNRAGGLEGGVEKINGVLHPGADPLKKSPQSGTLIDPAMERSHRPGTGPRGAGHLTSNKPAVHRLGSSSSLSEPVYPCGICLSEVNDDQEAILCEASCQKWFHRVCTGMTETAYNLLTAEAAAVWGCDGCMQEKGAPLLKTRETPAPLTANSESQS
ncbi:pygopus homolog 1 [Brachyhypopomus gauderio]|uniref:pygopus homolog 1 n=1 Tax=Brachyhypopomus gauderio TaxID=698409 RepID=UPI0040423930